MPAWLSYTISGPYTRAGQPLAEAFAVAADVPEIVAVGVNCCAPADVLPAIEIARDVTDKPVIVYPNSGEAWDGALARGSARRGGRRSWRRSGSPRAHASSAAAAGCGPTTSPSWLRPSARVTPKLRTDREIAAIAICQQSRDDARLCGDLTYALAVGMNHGGQTATLKRIGDANAFEFEFDPSLLDRLTSMYENLVAPKLDFQALRPMTSRQLQGITCGSTSSPTAALAWVSADDLARTANFYTYSIVSGLPTR